MEQIRLQKFLANAGVSSRRKCEELILQGNVSINGIIVTELGTKVDPEKDKVTVFQELPVLHTICGAQRNDYTCNILHHPQYMDGCGRYCNSTCTGIFGDASHCGSSCGFSSGIHCRTFYVMCTEVDSEHLYKTDKGS